VDDPEVVDAVGDEGSGMFRGEFEGAASFVEVALLLCCVKLDKADLRYGGDSWA